MKIKLIFCFFLSILLITSCQNKNTITIISYNAQTFFDLINDGREFEQFKKSKNKWINRSISLESRQLEVHS